MTHVGVSEKANERKQKRDKNGMMRVGVIAVLGGGSFWFRIMRRLWDLGFWAVSLGFC